MTVQQQPLREPDAQEAAYRSLVAGYIACEKDYFGQTEPISEEPQQ